MITELNLIKELMSSFGYRFEIGADGVQRVYRPDGTLTLSAHPSDMNQTQGVIVAENEPPDDVYQSADGFWYRHFLMPSGVQGAQRVCEDCWQNMPPYLNAKLGFVSPESEGKYTSVSIVGEHCNHKGVMPMQKAICRECYLAAYHRVYPNAPLPDMSGELREDKNNAMEWSATNVSPAVIHLDADDGQHVQQGRALQTRAQ